MVPGTGFDRIAQQSSAETWDFRSQSPHCIFTVRCIQRCAERLSGQLRHEHLHPAAPERWSPILGRAAAEWGEALLDPPRPCDQAGA